MIPQFYDRDSEGIPIEWVSKIRVSMGALTPLFQPAGLCGNTLKRYYIPAAEHYLERAANQGEAQR